MDLAQWVVLGGSVVVLAVFAVLQAVRLSDLERALSEYIEREEMLGASVVSADTRFRTLGD